MEDYGFLIALGVVAVITVIAGIKLRPKGKKKKPGGKKRGKGGKEVFFQSDAYQDMGGDGGEFEDSDLYAMKEGKGGGLGPIDDEDEDPKKKEEYDSWDNY